MKKSLIVLFILAAIAVTGCGKQKAADTTNVEAVVNEEATVTPSPTALATPTPIPISNDSLYPAYVTENGVRKYGYINQSGSFIIEPKYTTATDFSDGIALVKDETESKYINIAGNVIFKGTDDVYISSPFVNGAAVFTTFNDTTSKFGYLDTQGNILLESIYDRADDFKEDGTAFVIVNGKYEKINKSGDIIDSSNVNNRYSYILDFKDGYIIYEDPDTQTAGVVDYKGNVILTPPANQDIYPVYNSIIYLGNNLFGVGDNSKNYTYFAARPYAIFDNKGNQITDYKFYDLSPFHNGYASVTDDNYTYFINEKGETAADLPKLEGRGTLTLMGNVIKAEIDGDLIYMTKDGTYFWQAILPQKLENGLILDNVKVKPNKFVTVYYPVLEGLSSKEVQDKINQELKKLFTDSRKNLTKDDELSVEDTFQGELLGNMLIINRIGYDYYFGAAHGMPLKDYYHIDLSDGQIYSLPDLFLEGSDYVGVINKIIKSRIEEAQKDDNSLYFDGFETILKDQFFHLTRDGIVIYFYPYDIAGYAAGFQEFLISYDDLKNVINYNGPMWKAFHE